mgnify:CR=1 FL=1
MKNIMEDWKDEYLTFDARYKNHVEKFLDYLKLPNVNKADKPAKLDEEDVDNSVCYYVKCGNIKSIDSMNSHLESIKAFYNYLIKKGYVEKNIIPVATYADYKNKISLKYNLKERVEREWIENSDIKLILDKFDSYFENTEYRILGKEARERYVYWLSLRIYIKICLIAPAKKNVLINLKFSSLSNDFRILKINGINILIPNGLRYNIIHTLQFINNIKGKRYTSNDKILEYISGIGGEKDIKGTKLNSSFCYFLKEYDLLEIPNERSSYPVEVISNTTLYNLVVQGTNPYYIAQISGSTISRLEKKYYSKIDEIKNIKDVHNELNNSVSKCDYYQYI